MPIKRKRKPPLKVPPATSPEFPEDRKEREFQALGASTLAALRSLVAALDTEDEDAREEASQAIQEDPLSIQVRSDWYDPTEGQPSTPGEFEILLSTGGPATRIRGELRDGQPYRAWLECQDWGTPWRQYLPCSSDVCLAYASCFYFGEY